jgi:hypothetical protein
MPKTMEQEVFDSLFLAEVAPVTVADLAVWGD